MTFDPNKLINIPWHRKILFWFQNHIQTQKDIKTAKLEKVQRHKELSEYKFVTSIFGKTEIVDVGYSLNTHMWILYKNGYGDRKVVFQPTNNGYVYDRNNGSDHPNFSKVERWRTKVTDYDHKQNRFYYAEV